MSYIPNGSYLYNTEDKKLYGVTNMTFEVKNDAGDDVEIVTRHPSKWIPEDKPVSDYTFNLVSKTYPWGRAETLLAPVEHENVLFFATAETTELILKKLNDAFDGVEFDYVGETDDPINHDDRVYVLADRNANGEVQEFDAVGNWAILEATKGTDAMLESARVGLVNLGFID